MGKSYSDIEKESAKAILPSVNDILDKIDEYDKKKTENIINNASNIKKINDDTDTLISDYDVYINTIRVNIDQLKGMLEDLI